MMKRIRKSRLSESASSEIKHYINANGLSEGDRLPSLADLGEQLGVGRSTLREAVQQLEADGYLDIQNGKGIFIKATHPLRIQASFEVENERHFLLETLDVRQALEGKAVELATYNASADDIAAMQHHLDNYNRYLENGQRDQATLADQQFHAVIYNSAGNAVLKTIIDSMHHSFQEFWNSPFGKDDIFDASHPYHQDLLDAITQSDIQRSMQAFKMIMDSVRSSIQNID